MAIINRINDVRWTDILIYIEWAFLDHQFVSETKLEIRNLTDKMKISIKNKASSMRDGKVISIAFSSHGIVCPCDQQAFWT